MDSYGDILWYSRYQPKAEVVASPRRSGMYVTPHMVTNSFQERGLPIWKFFCPPARSGTGTPRMVMGIGVFALP
jgi:hypothetical protein